MTSLFSLEAEQSVLGSILIDPSCFDEVVGIVKPIDFYRRAHQVIFSTMKDMVEEGCPLDLVTLTERLQATNKLDDIGGVSYLTDLAESVPTTANTDHYAKIVHDKSVLRHLKQVGLQISNLNDQVQVEDALSKAETLVNEISDHYLSGNKDTVRDIDSLMLTATKRLEERIENKGKIQGLETGFYDLDQILTGLHKGDLIILAARPSMGKTALALNIASNVAIDNDKTVILFSLEMSNEQLIDRLICSKGHIDSQSYRSGKLTDDDYDKYARVLSTMSGKRLFIDDKPNMTVAEVKAKCHKIKRNHGLDLIIVDYLQQIQPDKDVHNRNEEISRISRSLKIMARELNVPVISLCQLSRAVEMRQDKRPMLSDLRDSGAIEQDADVVAFLYRDDYYNEETEKKNIAEVIIGKHRNGPVGKVELLFLKEYSKFLSLSRV